MKQIVVKKGATRLNGASKTVCNLRGQVLEAALKLTPPLKQQRQHQPLAATLCINYIFHLEIPFIALSLCAHKTKTTLNRNIYLCPLTLSKQAKAWRTTQK
ncbi:MAG: hypothetical protein LRY74_09380 [Shewanella xiamenensis]|nr:hypothetical protein [Shewanella xiamenensis]